MVGSWIGSAKTLAASGPQMPCSISRQVTGRAHSMEYPTSIAAPDIFRSMVHFHSRLWIP
jgi:hypothetical protein